MGIHQPIEHPAGRDALRREGQILRGRFLDAFARLGSSVQEYGRMIGVKQSPNAPFSRHLKALQGAKDSPAKLTKWFDQVAEINLIRADIVHSVIETVQICDGKSEKGSWQFRNVGNASAGPRVLTSEEFNALVKRVADLTNTLNQRLKAPTPTAPASTTG